MKANLKAELILDNRGITSEGPAWDERKGVLHFVDIEQCYVYTYNPKDGSHTRFTLPENCSTICLTEDPDVLVTTLVKTVVAISAKDGSILRTLATVPEKHNNADWRFNEGKVAPCGVFILGRMHLEGPMGGPPGHLYKLDMRTEEGKQAGLVTLLEESQVPNGMSWDMKKKVMYYNDTPNQTCTAYATDDEGVPIQEGDGLKSVKVLKIEEGNPDGHTIDSDGNIWEALASSNMVICYNPDSGEILHKVEVPVTGISAATFGGPNLDELYITTLNHEGGQEKGEGGLYRAKAPEGVKGVAGAYYGKILV